MADLKFQFGDKVYFKNGSQLQGVIIETFPNDNKIQYKVLKKGYINPFYVSESEIELWEPRKFKVGDKVIVSSQSNAIGEITELDFSEYTPIYTYLVKYNRQGKSIERFIDERELQRADNISETSKPAISGPSALNDCISNETFRTFSKDCFGNPIAIEMLTNLTPMNRPELYNKSLILDRIYDIEQIKTSSGYTILNITYKKP